LSWTTRVSHYQKGKTHLDFNEARDSEWQWHQLGHMQICNLPQTENHGSTPPLGFCLLDALPAKHQELQYKKYATHAMQEYLASFLN